MSILWSYCLPCSISGATVLLTHTLTQGARPTCKGRRGQSRRALIQFSYQESHLPESFQALCHDAQHFDSGSTRLT